MMSLRLGPRLGLTAGLLGFFVFFSEGRAAAQAASEQAAAEALFNQARDLMAAKQYADACPKFAESQRLDPAPGTLLNLATCYERNGQIASAWVTYKEAATSARKADQGERARLARDKAAELEPKLPTLTISVAATTDRPDLEIRRDGATVGRAEWGAAIPVDPGTHAIEAMAPGHKTWQGKSTIAGAGDKQSIEVPPLDPLLPEASSSAAAPATSTTTPASASAVLASAPPPEPSGGHVQRTAGVVIGAIGLGIAAVGGVFGIIATVDKSQTTGECLETGSSLLCSTKGYDAARDAKATATASTIGLIAGGTLFATGVIVFLAAPSKSAPALGWLAPFVDGHAAGARLGASW